MKKLKKIVKLWIIYVLVTGYCCHVTDQFVMIADPEGDIETEKLEYEFAWKHIFDNCKILFNCLKQK